MLEEAQALDEAARETLKRIDEDRKKVPPNIRRLLVHIRGHLFTEGYGVGELKRAFGEAGEGLTEEFRIVVGEAPSKYISGARLETASRLLRDTRLAIGTISLLVGYARTGPFSTAFKRWYGMSPKEFREQSRQVEEEERWPEDDLLSSRLFRDLERGDADGDAAQARRLSSWFRKLYPDTDSE